MNEKDIIILKNENGIDEEVELVLTVNINKKQYLLYKTKEDEFFASYIIEGDNELHNDLTDKEYQMLENLYRKGSEANEN